MKINKKIMMLAVIAAFMMVAVPVIVAQDGVNAETGDISADGITVNFVKDVDYGDYGKAANSTTTSGVDSLGNSITVTYDSASKTFIFTGFLKIQDPTDDSTFNRLGSPDDKPYGIVFEITVPNAGDKIKIGTGSEGTATEQDKKFQSLLYLDLTKPHIGNAIKYTPLNNEAVEYKFDLTGLYEAKIGDVYYATFEDAVSAAASESTIELLKDVTLETTLTVSKKISITGEYEVSAASNFSTPSKNAMIYVTSAGDLTINGPTFDANEKSRAILNEGGKLTLTTGTVTGGYVNNTYVAGIYNTSNGVFNMTGGTITGNTIAGTYASDNYLQYSADLWIGANATGDINALSGGTVGNVFVNANQYSATNPGSLKLNGITATNVYVEYDHNYGAVLNYTGGTITNLFVSTTTSGTSVKAAPVTGTTYTGGMTFEAKIGDVYYATFEDAVSAAASESTIELLKNVTLETTLTVSKKISVIGAFEVKANDSFTPAVNMNALVSVTSTGDLTINGPTFDANGKSRVIHNVGKLTLTTGTVTGGYVNNTYIAGIYNTNNGVFNMTGGTITGNTIAGTYASDNYLQYSADLWIGANATGDINALSGGTVGNVFVNANSYSAQNPGSLTFNGVTATNVYVEYDHNYGAVLNYTGGTITNLFVSTTTSGTSVKAAPVTGTTYIGGMTFEAVSDSVYYVNLGNALDLVESGTVTLNKAAVTVDETLSIKSGVTLETSTNVLTIGDNGVLNVSGTLKDAYASDATAKTIDNKGKINVLAGGKLLVGYQPAVTGVNIDGKINVTATGLLQCNDGSDTKLIGGNDAVINLTAGSIDFYAKSVGGAVAYTLNTASKASINAFPFKSGDSITIDGELTAVDNLTISTGVTMNVNGIVIIESAKSIVITGTGAVTVSSDGAITGGTIDFTDATLGSKVLTVENGGMLTTILDGSDAATLEQPAKPSKMELKSVVAGVNGIIIAKGSVVIDGTYSTDADGTITITSGTATITGTVDEGVKIVVPAGVTVVIPEGGTLEFDAGSSFENSGTINFESPTSSTIIYEEGSTVNGVEIEVTTKQTEGGVIVAIIITLKTANADKLLLKVDGQYLEVYYVEAFEGDSYADALAGIEVESLKSRVSFDGWYNNLNEKVTTGMVVGSVAPTLTAKFTETPREGVTPHTPSIEPTVITVDETGGYDNTTMLVAAVAMLVVAIFVLGYVVIVKRK